MRLSNINVTVATGQPIGIPAYTNFSVVPSNSVIRVALALPFTSLAGTVVDPDVVTIGFLPPGVANTAPPTAISFTYTNGVTPPDPTYTVNRQSFSIATVTPSYPAVGQVGFTTSTPNDLVVGQTVTIAGVSPSGYSGTFLVAGVQGGNEFSVLNSTVTTPSLTSATVTANGVYYAQFDVSTYPTGAWKVFISGAPGTSVLDTTKTKVYYDQGFLVSAY
jgi:hypothetical protein